MKAKEKIIAFLELFTYLIQYQTCFKVPGDYQRGEPCLQVLTECICPEKNKYTVSKCEE